MKDNKTKEVQNNEQDALGNTETWARSFVKAVSWRAVGTLDTVLLAWIITGTVRNAVKIGAAELITKMILYTFHERAWGRITWGRIENNAND